MAIEERSGWIGVLLVEAVCPGSCGRGFCRPWIAFDVVGGSCERVLAGKLKMSGELSDIVLSKLPGALTCKQLASIMSSNIVLTLLDEELEGQFECWEDWTSRLEGGVPCIGCNVKSEGETLC
jgi:hypothetical protein